MKLKKFLIAVSVAMAMAVSASAKANSWTDGIWTNDEKTMAIGAIGVAVGEAALGAPILAIGACMKYKCLSIYSGGEDFDDLATWKSLTADQRASLFAVLELSGRENCIKRGRKSVMWSVEMDSDKYAEQVREANKGLRDPRALNPMRKRYLSDADLSQTVVDEDGKIRIVKESFDDSPHSFVIHSEMATVNGNLAHRGMQCEGTRQGNGGRTVETYDGSLEVWVTKSGQLMSREAKTGKRWESVTHKIDWADAKKMIGVLQSDDQAKSF